MSIQSITAEEYNRMKERWAHYDVFAHPQRVEVGTDGEGLVIFIHEGGRILVAKDENASLLEG